MPSQTCVFYLSDEIFALHTPILVTMDAASTAILNLALASERSADTWRAHFEALEAHHFFSLGMASARGLGLVAGSRAACDMAWWVADDFHECRDLFEVRHQVERKAYAALDKEDEAARKFARAQSESTLVKRLQQYATAHHTCEQAMALYDHLALLLHLLREALHICSPHGRLRKPCQDILSTSVHLSRPYAGRTNSNNSNCCEEKDLRACPRNARGRYTTNASCGFNGINVPCGETKRVG